MQYYLYEVSIISSIIKLDMFATYIIAKKIKEDQLVSVIKKSN